jgi:hypothetical protein
MRTYNVELNHKPNKDGLFMIFARITENRKLRRIKTGILVPKEHFNPKARYGRWVRTANAKHTKYNES